VDWNFHDQISINVLLGIGKTI